MNDHAAPLHSCKYRRLHARDLNPQWSVTVERGPVVARTTNSTEQSASVTDQRVRARVRDPAVAP
jgi:hypothetical protein